jgi:hypothetical protein
MLVSALAELRGMSSVLDAADAKCQAQICRRASYLTIRALWPAGSGPSALGVV